MRRTGTRGNLRKMASSGKVTKKNESQHTEKKTGETERVANTLRFFQGDSVSGTHRAALWVEMPRKETRLGKQWLDGSR